MLKCVIYELLYTMKRGKYYKLMLTSMKQLALELKCFHLPCAAVNTVHLHCLDQIEKQYGLVQVGSCPRMQVYHPSNESVAPPVPVSQDNNFLTPEPICLDENLLSANTHRAPTGFQEEFVCSKVDVFVMLLPDLFL